MNCRVCRIFEPWPAGFSLGCRIPRSQKVIEDQGTQDAVSLCPQVTGLVNSAFSGALCLRGEID